MHREQIKFFHQLRVRYAEVDSQGIVFNAHYLTWFDTALTEYMRAIEFDYQGLIAEQQLDFHLVKSTVEYFAPIGFDETIEIGVSPARTGNTSITWELSIFRQDSNERLTKGEIIWVCSKVNEHKSHPLPTSLLDSIEAYEQS